MKLIDKFIAAALGIILLSMGAILILIFTHERAQQRDQATVQQIGAVSETAKRLQDFYAERTSDIKDVATHHDLATAVSSPASAAGSAQISHNFVDFMSTNPNWTELVALDTTSHVRGSVGEVQGWSDPEFAPIYRDALAGKITISAVRMAQNNGAPYVTIAAPIQRSGKIVGVVAGNINWSKSLSILKDVSNTNLYIVGNTGLLLGSNQSNAQQDILVKNLSTKPGFSQILGSKTGTLIMPGFITGTEMTLTSYTPLVIQTGQPSGEWKLVTSRPVGEIYTIALQWTLIMGGLITLALIATVTILLWQLWREVVLPIQVLVGTITKVSLGDLNQTVPPLPDGELGHLGRSFNKMVSQLSSTQQNLSQAIDVAADGQAQLEASINSLRQGFILTDANGKQLLANDAARTLLHKSGNSETHNRSELIELLPSEFNISENVAHTMDKKQAMRLPNIAIHEHYINLYLSPVIRHNEAIGCVLLLEDVTAERLLQRSRDEFFSIASHELRTPLTAIRGNASIMSKYYPEAMKDSDLKVLVTDIHDSAVRLIEIVNDFLDASRLEQSKVKYTTETVQIDPIIEGIIYEMGNVSRDKAVRLHYENKTTGLLPLVYVDKNRLKQVLYNLIGNALKFTDKGTVSVECFVERKHLKVCVSDTGPGISSEGQQRLFHKFQQTGSDLYVRDATRGTGLGLYISKLLIEQMGGKVTLEHSEVGKGTTFSFTVPLAPTEALPSHTTDHK